MTVREKTRLDKFKQLLASPNTDLGRLIISAEFVLKVKTQCRVFKSRCDLEDHILSSFLETEM